MKLDLKTGLKVIMVLLAVFLVGGAMFSPSYGKQITKPDNRIAYAAESVDQHMYLPIILGFESSYSKATLFGVEFVGTVVDYNDL